MKNYKKPIVLLSIFLVIFTANSYAQTATITGNITDKTGQIIPFVSVRINESGKGTIASVDGKYTLQHPAGKYTLIVSSVGYITDKQKFILTKGQVLTLNISLETDSKALNEVSVAGKRNDQNGLRRLNDVENMAIYAGKKNEVVVLGGINANLATNNARQIYAKVPGVNIIENDAAGIQLGIATRGLNPNRTTEFNTRQNGYDISADPIGYPESYYTPPTEAIDRIEIVRGAASLQYGTQFGGLLNFQFKKGNPDKKIEFVSRQTGGTYGLFNSFNSVGGQIGKLNYYAFFTHKQGDGWRQNTNFNVNTGYISLAYQLSEKLKIGAELTSMSYLMQQPGGLTDTQFNENPQASYRNRNWFQAKWNMPVITLDYQIDERTKFNVRAYGLIAERGSIGNIINPIKDRTDSTQRRQLTYDHYNNFGTEARLLHRYALFSKKASFLVGLRYYQGNTQRQQGTGFKGNDANFNFLNPQKLDEFDYRFPSYNAAIFLENVWWLNEKISITPGIRYEYINSNSDGYSYDEVTNKTFVGKQQNIRQFPLLGIGVNYAITSQSEIYFNISQNYSPVNYADILVRTPNFQVDPNLKDVTGFNADLGFRGNYKNWLNYDLSAYYLDYNNRIGIIRIASADGLEVVRYRTNVGRSRSIGIETFGELNFSKMAHQNPKNEVSLFGSFAYTDATYTEAINPLLKTLIVGKQVEYAPKTIIRTGLTFQRKTFRTTVQFARTSQQFTDAYNSPQTADGLVGEIPAYYLVDLSSNYQYKKWTLGFSVNNLTNNHYFTRRALGFPGPGIIPADARSAFLSLELKL
ncbi:Fe(3+) dicitrate transport protein [Arcicella aurantiaca]|uniref:Fe(3+) dicitrate transport protein n=1 Tax=Arcicella aurantiaca TaxID=591202 RepID=A0A316DPS7_9BACT|nr:TonB-dependent receptor [Arcicella aurantiaca]PWK20081.1 Fe(3+) dicitrate transport protein [Arcicella aurantiaca]